MSESRRIWLIKVWGILLVLASGICFSDQALSSVQSEYYSIHTASYRRKSGADSDINRFRALGHEAFYRKSEVPGKGIWYRVFVGRFARESEARSFGEELKSKEILGYYSIQKFDAAFLQSALAPAASAARQEAPPAVQLPPADSDVQENPPAASAMQETEPAVQSSPADSGIQENPPEQPPELPDLSDAADGNYQAVDKPVEDRVEVNDAPVEKALDAEPDSLKTYPVPKLSDGKAGLSVVNPLFDEALTAFKSSDYQRALEILSAMESGQAGDGQLSERISRRLADCYFFLAPRKGNSYFLIAAERYKKILLEYPDRPENADGFYRLGRSYEILKFYYEALDAYRLLIINYPDTAYTAEASFKVGEMLHNIGRFDQTIDHLKSWQRQYPDDIHAKTAAFLIADCYYRLRQAVNAENRYREAMQQWPDYGDISLDLILNMGAHHYQNQKYADAVHAFSMAASLYPDDERIPDTLYILGRILQKAGRPEGALAMLGLVRGTYPKTSDQAAQLMADMGILNPGMRVLGFVGADAYLYPVETYNALIAKSGSGELTAALMAKKAEALRKTGQLAQCVDVYSELLDRFPAGAHDEESRYQLRTVTQTLVQQYFQNGGDLAVADLYFKTYGQGLIRFDGQDVDTGLKLGTSLVNIGLPRVAKKIYAELQGICRNASCRGRILLGNARADAVDGRKQEASESLLALIADSVGLTAGQVREAKILAAGILFDLNRYSEAAECYGEVLTGGDNASENRIHLQYAAALRHAGKTDASCEAYQSVVERCLQDDQTPDSQWMQAYTGLGECRYLQKRYADGIAAFEKALAHADAKDRAWPLYQLVWGGVQVNDRFAAEKRLAELRQIDEFWAQAAQRWIEESNWRETNQQYLK